MTTTSVTDVMECGGRVTIEEVLIFVDAPVVVLLILVVVFTALASMASKKSSSVPGVCTMFLKMSSPAFLRNRRRLRDQVIFARVTDTNDISSNWVEFNPRSGTSYLDMPLPSRQSRLSLVEMRITCPDTYHCPSSQHSEWSKSATSQLRRLMSIQSRHLDYKVDSSITAVTTSTDGAKVEYPLTPRPIKSSTQDIIERGCLVWLSLCLAGVLSFGISQYINLAYSELATAVVINALDILVTTANAIAAVISGILAFLFVKILATPFRRSNRRRRRGNYRRLGSHTLGRDRGGDIKTSVTSSPIVQSFEAVGSELHASIDCSTTNKAVDPQANLRGFDEQTSPDELIMEDELYDTQVDLEASLKSTESLECLENCLTLKSPDLSMSSHSLPSSASSIYLQSPAFSSVSFEPEDICPQTNQPAMVKAAGSQLANAPLEVTTASSPMTNEPAEVTGNKLHIITKPMVETYEEHPLTNKPAQIGGNFPIIPKSKSLSYLDSLTLKSKSQNHSRHFMSTSQKTLTDPPAFFQSPLEQGGSSPLANTPEQIKEESSLSTNHLAEIATETSPITSGENSPQSNHPGIVTNETSVLINIPTVTEEINAELVSLPNSSESNTSLSSSFTIESLPEILPGGVYQTEKYIYTEISCPWHHKPWLGDEQFQSDVYLDWLNDSSNHGNHGNSSYNNNNNNNNDTGSTYDLDIEECVEVAEPTIKITKGHATLFVSLLAVLGFVVAMHIYVINAHLCQKTFEAFTISWALASIILLFIWILIQFYNLCQNCIKN